MVRLLIIISIAFVFTSCVNNHEITIIPQDQSKAEMSSHVIEAVRIAALNSNDKNVANIVNSINYRVDLITERLADFQLKTITTEDIVYKDYYDADSLVCREGIVEYFDKIEGAISYNLYYDEEGFMIHAEITQYRNPSYFIYFHNEKRFGIDSDKDFDRFIRLVKGERNNKEEGSFDNLMINAIMLCFDHAYR